MSDTTATPSTELERHQPAGAVALTDRDMKSIGFQSQAIAFLDPRLKTMQAEEKKQTALGLAITLYNYGLPITVTNAKKLHLIQGEPVESAQLLIGLLEMAGHDIYPVETSDERCTLRGRRHGRGEPYVVTYTIEQARRSHALDEWVEKWEQARSGKNFATRFVVAVDGVPVENIPDWAADLVAAGKAKRKDAWFDYRSDMLAARCIRRLAKWMGADALLGAGSPVDSGYDDQDDTSSDDWTPPAAASASPPSPDGADDIEDADVVDEEPEDTFAPPPSRVLLASEAWARDVLAHCAEAVPEGVRPGALAGALVRHVTKGERSELSTVRRGSEQLAIKDRFVEYRNGRWTLDIDDQGVATLVEATPEAPFTVSQNGADGGKKAQP